MLALRLPKAFDTLDCWFMYRALRKFNFGEGYTWVKVFYTNIKSTITNGYSQDGLVYKRVDKVAHCHVSFSF